MLLVSFVLGGKATSSEPLLTPAPTGSAGLGSSCGRMVGGILICAVGGATAALAWAGQHASSQQGVVGMSTAAPLSSFGATQHTSRDEEDMDTCVFAGMHRLQEGDSWSPEAKYKCLWKTDTCPPDWTVENTVMAMPEVVRQREALSDLFTTRARGPEGEFLPRDVRVAGDADVLRYYWWKVVVYTGT